VATALGTEAVHCDVGIHRVIQNSPYRSKNKRRKWAVTQKSLCTDVLGGARDAT